MMTLARSRMAMANRICKQLFFVYFRARTRIDRLRIVQNPCLHQILSLKAHNEDDRSWLGLGSRTGERKWEIIANENKAENRRRGKTRR